MRDGSGTKKEESSAKAIECIEGVLVQYLEIIRENIKEFSSLFASVLLYPSCCGIIFIDVL